MRRATVPILYLFWYKKINEVNKDSMNIGSYQFVLKSMYEAHGDKVKLVIVIIFKIPLLALLFALIMYLVRISEKSEMLPAIAAISNILWIMYVVSIVNI